MPHPHHELLHRDGQQHAGQNDRKAVLLARLRELKIQRRQLQARLNEVGQRIRSIIAQIREKKSKRNALTDAVKGHKEERLRLSQEIRGKIEVAKQLKVQALSMPVRPGHGEGPGRLKARIEDLNRRIETEALTFEKEKQVMRQIKELQSAYAISLKEHASRQGHAQISREINELKAKADALHEIMQGKAALSQGIHEEVLELSKQVDALKSEEGSVKGDFLKVKKEEEAVSAALAGIMASEKAVQAQSRAKQEQEDTERIRKRLNRRISEVHEKMKQGEKLTTEDLIILQGEEI